LKVKAMLSLSTLRLIAELHIGVGRDVSQS